MNLSFFLSFSRSIFCLFLAISFATMSEKSSLLPGTPALFFECASYLRLNSSSFIPSSSDASSDTSIPFFFCHDKSRKSIWIKLQYYIIQKTRLKRTLLIRSSPSTGSAEPPRLETSYPRSLPIIPRTLICFSSST